MKPEPTIDDDTLDVPLICPFCGWQGTDSEAKIEWERIIPSLIICGDIKWTCPKCEMVIHRKDEEERDLP